MQSLQPLWPPAQVSDGDSAIIKQLSNVPVTPQQLFAMAEPPIGVTLTISTTAPSVCESARNLHPLSTIARGIEIDLREMMNEEPAGIPAPLPAQHDVHM